MYSVVDECGINAVSQQVFTNAGYAIAGMANAPILPPPAKPKGSMAMTMFGVTTVCMSTIEKEMSAEYDALVFHCTGAGGEGMEALIRAGKVQAVMDLTTTEICDLVAGQLHGASCQGVMSAGPNRLEAVAESGVPAVVSVGALDMVNYNGVDTVPTSFAQGSDRVLFVHNEGVTLMRTNVEENTKMAEHIVAQLKKAKAPIVLLLPEGGVSLLDGPENPVDFWGATFDNWQKIKELEGQGLEALDLKAKKEALKARWHDPAANEALLTTLEKGLEGCGNVKIVKVPHNLNSTEFASVAIAEFKNLS